MRVRPFRGYRYAIGREREISKVVAPPYDQISAEQQDALYAMSPANIVRVSYPRDDGDKYARARATLDAWLAEGVWGQEESPAIYPYHQTYRVGSREVTRVGLVALGQVTDYAGGEVLPHERTHAGPKQDRMRLLEATGADTGLLFMVVADASGALLEASRPGGEPIAEARDLRGERHRLWRVTDAAAVARVQAALAAARVIIADGHHRYETAVEYARRHPGADDKLMAFFSLDAPGLTIFPNHRLVHRVDGFSLARLSAGARRWFEVAPLADPLAFRPTNRALGVVTADSAVTLTLRPDAFDALPWPAGTSRAWRELAVSILHEGVLKPLGDVSDERLDAGTHVEYTADQEEAVRLARAGRYQAAFLIAPTTLPELQAVVRGGEVLPQKSTHFYPKLLDGLVFHRI
ncbi:MAG: DUF1015 domain-containing protein [Candidatus Rokuibacteriota bacterium]|nr:MAG: DUF1015 domain-containing protein [Candidatus Rokubacteria bacterium]PYN21711.1 MAG: DUF1015 domain-containing protein [Candidatus Rokubacteria bacterium]